MGADGNPASAVAHNAVDLLVFLPLFFGNQARDALLAQRVKNRNARIFRHAAVAGQRLQFVNDHRVGNEAGALGVLGNFPRQNTAQITRVDAAVTPGFQVGHHLVIDPVHAPFHRADEPAPADAGVNFFEGDLVVN